jgi:electron transfer flavoprotein beta subunit
MKILVPVKRVVDYNIKIRVKSDGSGVELANAIDDDCNQTGQMLAALTGWGQGAFASKVVIGEGGVEVTREVDGGMQTVALKLPAIVTTDLRLNEPRYASLPNIMKAKKKPIDEKTPADYGVDVAPRLKVLKTSEPSGRKAGVKSVAELVAKLHDEAGVI